RHLGRAPGPRPAGDRGIHRGAGRRPAPAAPPPRGGPRRRARAVGHPRPRRPGHRGRRGRERERRLAVPRQLVAGHRSRGDREPHGGHRDRRDLPRTAVAMGAAPLRPSVMVEHTLARRGAERLWALLQREPYVKTFGALTGTQAVQMVKAGLEAIYLSGWQVAADANLAGQTYPDQSLYPSNSVPALVRRLNNALMRADQIQRPEG